MKKFLIVAAMAVVASAANAVDLIWSGDLNASSPTFNRPTSMTTTSSGVFRYDVQPFYVTATGNYVFESDQSSGAYDGYIFLYAATFVPTTPLVGLQDGDDDFAGAFTVIGGSSTSATRGSRIASTETSNFNDPAGSLLVAGVQYYAINSTFTAGTGGTYRAGIGGGPGDVVAGMVPEPASMIALGAGLLALARRRRK
jgi:hypothetical protein